jgi:transcriptional regulator with XRE-family HTH domain
MDPVGREGQRIEFGQRLRSAREKTGLSQAEAARRIGVARERVTEWENGVRIPRVLQLAGVIESLGLDPRDLFGGPPFIREAP